jgi:hypothetical protein
MNKYETSDMEQIISVLPEQESHDEAKEQIMIYRALCNPEAAGEAICRDAIQKLRVSTDGALFPIRYQKYGQELKGNLVNWCGRQLSSSLSQVRLKRLADESAGLAVGYETMPQWVTIRQQVDEFKSAKSSSQEDASLISAASDALDSQIRHCLQVHQSKYDEIMMAIGFTIENGALVCNIHRVASAVRTYQVLVEQTCEIKTIVTPAFFEAWNTQMLRQKGVLRLLHLLQSDPASRLGEQLDELAGALADVHMLASTQSAFYSRASLMADEQFLQLVHETDVASQFCDHGLRRRSLSPRQ